MFSCSVVSKSLRPYGLQHARLPHLSQSPRVCSNSCPVSQWCYPTMSSSVALFSSCLQSCPASGSIPESRVFASGGQSIGAAASVLPMKIQGYFPLWLIGLITLLSKGLSRVFSSTTVRISSLRWRKGWVTSQAILKSLCPCSRDSRKSSNSSHIWKATWKDSDEEVLERHSSRQSYVCWASSVCWVLKPPAWRKVWCGQRTDKTHA